MKMKWCWSRSCWERVTEEKTNNRRLSFDDDLFVGNICILYLLLIILLLLLLLFYCFFFFSNNSLKSHKAINNNFRWSLNRHILQINIHTSITHIVFFFFQRRYKTLINLKTLWVRQLDIWLSCLFAWIKKQKSEKKI